MTCLKPDPAGRIGKSRRENMRWRNCFAVRDCSGLGPMTADRDSSPGFGIAAVPRIFRHAHAVSAAVRGWNSGSGSLSWSEALSQSAHEAGSLSSQDRAKPLTAFIFPWRQSFIFAGRLRTRGSGSAERCESRPSTRSGCPHTEPERRRRQRHMPACPGAAVPACSAVPRRGGLR